MNTAQKEIKATSILINQPDSTKDKLIELNNLIKDPIASNYLNQFIKHGVLVEPKEDRAFPSITAKSLQHRKALDLLLSNYGLKIHRNRLGKNQAKKGGLDYSFLYYSVEEIK